MPVKNEHYLDVDIKLKNYISLPRVTQYDDVFFIVRILDDGRPVSLASVQTFLLASLKPNKETVYTVGTVNEDEITFKIESTALNVKGRIQAAVQLHYTDGRTSTIPFYYEVIADSSVDYVPETSETSLIQLVLGDAPFILEAAQTATIGAEDATALTFEALDSFDVEKSVAIQELDDVKEDNRITWKQEVSTVALRDSTYPTPQIGDTVRITGEARIDRFNGTEWITTDRYNPAVVDELTVKLADTVKKSETGILDLNIFDEPTRAAIQGIEPGTINAVLGVGNVKPKNTDFLRVNPTNLYNPTEATNGIRLNGDGTFLTDATYSLSAMIPVSAGDIIVSGFGQPAYKSSRIGGYNSDGSFLKIVDNNGFESTSPALVREAVIDFNGFIRVPFQIAGKSWAIVAKKIDYIGFRPFGYLLSEEIAPKVPENSVGKVNLQDGAVTFEKAEFLDYAKNLFDVSKATAGFYVNQGSGLLTAFTGHTASDFIKVFAGQTYTINSARKFAKYTDSKVFVSGLDLTGVAYTFTADINGYIRFSYTDDKTNIQMEKGSAVTGYEVFGYYNMPLLKLTDTQKAELVTEETAKALTLHKSGNAVDITSEFEEGDEITIKTVKNGSANGTFNFVETLVGGEIVHTNGDDITPIRTFTTVGANHGYPNIVVIGLSGHGKTTADLGSQWTDGTTVYTLLLISGNNLTFGCPYTVFDGVTSSTRIAPIADLTHVSGATNISSISIANILASQQLYPSVKNVNVKYLLDGKEVLGDGEHKGNELQVVESYDILDYKAIIDYAQSNIGTSYVNENVDGIVSLSITYTFTRGGKCHISHTFKTLKKVSIKNCGFLQSIALANSNYTLYRYMPNVIEKSGYDFRNIVNMTAYATDINFAASSLVDPTILPNRYVDILKDGSGDMKVGYTMGYIVDKTNSKHADRMVNTSIYWDMRGTKKVYPIAMSELTFEPGVYKTFMGYRNYLSPQEVGEATSINKVEDKKDLYVYIDFHQSVTGDNVQLNEHIGKAVSVVESSNFELLNDTVDAEGVTFNVTSTYGYAILKVS